MGQSKVQFYILAVGSHPRLGYYINSELDVSNFCDVFKAICKRAVSTRIRLKRPMALSSCGYVVYQTKPGWRLSHRGFSCGLDLLNCSLVLPSRCGITNGSCPR